ncbi:MAG: 30S ribosomal protein S6 [Planctomycetota bacterium]|nr:MAG: 30S ribosomal protein S6 [Planctomycetota bacterium]
MKTYEGMFLFDPSVTNEWENIQAEVKRLMDRAGTRMIVCSKWDERRLAYEIRGRKRGIYVLCFFEADPDRIKDLERDVHLSESILRCLIQKVEHLSEVEMKDIAARPANHSAVEADRITGRWSAVESSTAGGSRAGSRQEKLPESREGKKSDDASAAVDSDALENPESDNQEE